MAEGCKTYSPTSVGLFFTPCNLDFFFSLTAHFAAQNYYKKLNYANFWCNVYDLLRKKCKFREKPALLW